MSTRTTEEIASTIRATVQAAVLSLFTLAGWLSRF
ncbi:hypothetical protein FHR32_007409 [Streptosporangium album]|uniref:Uncharacterized protein n=1 Tax=Streptosporangium album TaxID=47479 RepID=A0A7W7S318_9ACTN|nr:hypothetical protein [Streptosporangium album]